MKTGLLETTAIPNVCISKYMYIGGKKEILEFICSIFWFGRVVFHLTTVIQGQTFFKLV
jgi:hypothetical protein